MPQVRSLPKHGACQPRSDRIDGAFARLGEPFARADHVLDAANAHAETARLLDVRRRRALLLVTRPPFGAQDTPIDYVMNRYGAGRDRDFVRLGSRQTPAGIFGGAIKTPGARSLSLDA